MAEKNIFDIVDDTNCGMVNAKTITSKLFRLSLYEQGYNYSKFSRQLDVLVGRLKGALKGKVKSINSLRGNIGKELVKKRMTWGNFKKGAMFHQAISSELQIVIVKNDKQSRLILPIHYNYINENISKNIITQAYSKIKSDLNLTDNDLITLLDNYLRSPKSRIATNNVRRNSMKGNILKELDKENMTWGNFERFLKILDPEHVSFALVMYRKNKTRFTHLLKVTKPNSTYISDDFLIDDRESSTLEYVPRLKY